MKAKKTNYCIWDEEAKKHNLTVFFSPWISPIWIKNFEITLKNFNEKNSYKKSPIKYSVNTGKVIPTMFSLTSYKQIDKYEGFIEEFFNNYNSLLKPDDFSHESFSIMKDISEYKKSDLASIKYPTFRKMMKLINEDRKIFKYRRLSHLDIKEYFKNTYVHSLTWDFENKKTRKNSLIDKIHAGYMKHIAYSETFGLPIGLNVSNLMAEVRGVKITKVIFNFLSKNDKDIKIYRYVDDIFILHNKKINFDDIKLLNNKLYTKYGYQFHLSNSKIKLNNYKNRVRWSSNYKKSKSFYWKKQDDFKKNFTSQLNKISLFLFDKKTGKFIGKNKNLKTIKKSLAYLNDFINDKALFNREKLLCFKTSDLLRFCGLPCQNIKPKGLYWNLYKKVINMLYVFYKKNIDSFYSEDWNNFGVLIYLKQTISIKDKTTYKIPKILLKKIKSAINDDMRLYILVCALYSYFVKKNKYKNFLDFIDKTYYSDIKWNQNLLENKKTIKWLAIDTYATYNMS